MKKLVLVLFVSLMGLFSMTAIAQSETVSPPSFCGDFWVAEGGQLKIYRGHSQERSWEGENFVKFSNGEVIQIVGDLQDVVVVVRTKDRDLVYQIHKNEEQVTHLFQSEVGDRVYLSVDYDLQPQSVIVNIIKGDGSYQTDWSDQTESEWVSLSRIGEGDHLAVVAFNYDSTHLFYGGGVISFPFKRPVMVKQNLFYLGGEEWNVVTGILTTEKELLVMVNDSFVFAKEAVGDFHAYSGFALFSIDGQIFYQKYGELEAHPFHEIKGQAFASRGCG